MSKRNPGRRSLAVIVATAAAFPLFGLTAAAAAPADKVEFCHATGSITNPFVLVEVSENSQHGDHEGDVPAVDGICGFSQ